MSTKRIAIQLWRRLPPLDSQVAREFTGLVYCIADSDCHYPFSRTQYQYTTPWRHCRWRWTNHWHTTVATGRWHWLILRALLDIIHLILAINAGSAGMPFGIRCAFARLFGCSISQWILLLFYYCRIYSYFRIDRLQPKKNIARNISCQNEASDWLNPDRNVAGSATVECHGSGGLAFLPSEDLNSAPIWLESSHMYSIDSNKSLSIASKWTILVRTVYEICNFYVDNKSRKKDQDVCHTFRDAVSDFEPITNLRRFFLEQTMLIPTNIHRFILTFLFNTIIMDGTIRILD